MKETVYVVNGWEGDMQIFHHRKNAIKELNKRVLLADDCELEIEEDDCLIYSWHDKTTDDDFTLEFVEMKFSD